MDGLLRQLRSGKVPRRPSTARHGGRPSTDTFSPLWQASAQAGLSVPLNAERPLGSRWSLGMPIGRIVSFQRAISPAAFAHRATARPASRGPSPETRVTNLDLTNSNSSECGNQLDESTVAVQVAFSRFEDAFASKFRKGRRSKQTQRLAPLDRARERRVWSAREVAGLRNVVRLLNDPRALPLPAGFDRRVRKRLRKHLYAVRMRRARG
jgi:hypothetical protein